MKLLVLLASQIVNNVTLPAAFNAFLDTIIIQFLIYVRVALNLIAKNVMEAQYAHNALLEHS